MTTSNCLKCNISYNDYRDCGCSIQDIDYIRAAFPGLNILYFVSAGDYQGTNYVVGYTKGKVLVSAYGYGSCSGCGAWGEGGEPTSPADLINSGIYGESKENTIKWITERSANDCDLANKEFLKICSEINRAFGLI